MEETKIGEIVYQDCGDHWEAAINGGWYVGRGKTKDEAREKAFKRITSEFEKLGLKVTLTYPVTEDV